MAQLHQLPSRDPVVVLDALRAVFEGHGPAIMPVDGDDYWHSLPTDAPADAALVIETSGSTATPKRVLLSASALRASAQAADARCDAIAAARGVKRDEHPAPRQWLLALPTHFIAGMNVLVRSVVAGTTPVMLDADHFTPEAFDEAAGRLESPRRATALVPAQLQRILEAIDDPQRSWAFTQRLAATMGGFDTILVGGQAVPAELMRRCRDLGWGIVRTYGSSETAGGCVYDAVPLDGVSVRADAGELLVSGPTLAAGYLDPNDASRWDARTGDAFFDEDGARWYRTGDVGEVDARGHVRVDGRLDDVLISGGVKVLPQRIEAVVQELPGYANAVVIAAPDAQWGQVPAVVVVDATASGLRLRPDPDFARWQEMRARTGELGAAARPALRAEIGELPRLRTGKINRQALSRALERILGS